MVLEINLANMVNSVLRSLALCWP